MRSRLLAVALLASLPTLAQATKPCPASACAGADGSIDAARCRDVASWIAVGAVAGVEHHFEGPPLAKDFATFTLKVERWEKGSYANVLEMPFQVGWCDNFEELPRDVSGSLRFYGTGTPGSADARYLHIEPAAGPVPPPPPVSLDAAPSRFALLDGVKVHYKSFGTGKTAVVFVHGWTCDMTSWSLAAKGLPPSLRTIFVDLPGHGQSDKPKVDYTMELFARAVDAVMTHAGVADAVLVGHSMGTPVIRQFYRLFPKRTKALVAVDGALKPLITDPKTIEAFLAPYDRPDYKDTIGKFADSMFTSAAPAAVKESTRAVMTSTPQHVVVSAGRGMMDLSIWRDDPIDVPLLVLLARSPFWTAEYEATVRRLAPDTTWHVLDGTGHFVMLEKPREFDELLVAFLKKSKLLR